MDANSPGSPPRPKASTLRSGRDWVSGPTIVGPRSKRMRFNYLRYLVNKIYFTEVTLSEEEQAIASLLQLELESYRDPSFQKKYASQLRETSFILTFSGYGSILLQSIPEVAIAFATSDLCVTKWAFYGRYHSSYSNQFKIEERVRRYRHPTPSRYVGVGYRDKGSSRNLAIDGTPTWQQVALFLAGREREESVSSSRYNPLSQDDFWELGVVPC